MRYDVTNAQKRIMEEAGSYFSLDSLNEIQLNLKKYQKDIDEIIQNLERWNGKTSQEKEYYLKIAYVKIMEFRSYILGENNKIQYRLYIRSNDENLSNVQIVNINEEDLMTVVNRDRTSLRLKQNLDSIINDANKDKYRESIFKMHMNNILQGFTPATRAKMKTYVVTREVINKYGGETSKLVENLVFQNIQSKKGPYPYTLRTFNRGWIYQAFDDTVEYFDQKNKSLEEKYKDEFHKRYFTKSLKYDNLVGFKGGDVGLAQIKANMASIMSKTTLLKYLKIIKNILNVKIIEDGSQASKEEVKEYIISNFTNIKDDTIGKMLDKIIDLKIEKIMKDLTN